MEAVYIETISYVKIGRAKDQVCQGAIGLSRFETGIDFLLRCPSTLCSTFVTLIRSNDQIPVFIITHDAPRPRQAMSIANSLKKVPRNRPGFFFDFQHVTLRVAGQYGFHVPILAGAVIDAVQSIFGSTDEVMFKQFFDIVPRFPLDDPMVHDEESLLSAIQRPRGSRCSLCWLDGCRNVRARFGGSSRFLRGVHRTGHARVFIIPARRNRYADFGDM